MIGDATDIVESVARSTIPGADLVLPDPPWYKTWWGIGAIGFGGFVLVLLAWPRPRYYVVGNGSRVRNP